LAEGSSCYLIRSKCSLTISTNIPHRRQQRKKELKKNKTSRTKARDAQVAATKSLDEIKSEIAKLERRQNRSIDSTGSALDANDTKKLERLRKELKIVQAEAGKRKLLADQAQLERDRELISAQRTVEGVKQLNESKYRLVRVWLSRILVCPPTPIGSYCSQSSREVCIRVL